MTSETFEAQIAYSVYGNDTPDGLKVCWSGAVDNIQFDILKLGHLEVYVAFRGTDEWADMWRHVWVRRDKLPDGSKIHRGWHSDFHKVLPIMYAVLREQMDLLACRVTFLGHSYGGALAQIAAYYYSGEVGPPRVHVRTYGSPRVGDRRFSQQLALKVESCYRYKVQGDPVTMVPLALRYKHGGTEIKLPFHKNPHAMKGYLKAITDG